MKSYDNNGFETRKNKIRIRILTNIIILFALVCVFALIYNTCGFYYLINDDMVMQKLAAGNVTGVPDGHLVFIRYTLGCVIAALFKVFPQIDWYGITLLSCLFLCYYLVLCRLFWATQDVRHRWLIRISGIVLTAFFLLDSSILFQFTVVSGVLAATALFYLISSRNGIGLFEYILVWILLLLSSLIRLNIFYMTLPMAGLIIVGKIVDSLKKEGKLPHGWSEWRSRLRFCRAILLKTGIVTFAGIMAFLAMTKVERTAYADTPWKEYSEYKHARSLIQDYYGWPSYKNNKEFWDSVDISKQEHSCLRMYGILPNMNAEKIIQIAEYAEEKADKSISEHLSDMGSVFKNGVQTESCRDVNILLALSLVILLFYSFKADRSEKLRIAAGILIGLAMLGYLLYKGRLPARIINVYDYSITMTILGFLLVRTDSMKRGALVCHMVWLTCCVFLFIFTFNQQSLAVSQYREKIRIHEEEADYMVDNQDKFFVVPTNTFKYVKQFSFYDIQERYSNTTGTYGWSIYSPWNTIRLKNFGIDEDDNILLQPNVYLLTVNMSHADILNRYLRSAKYTKENYEIVDERELSDGQMLHCVKWTPRKS